MKIKEIIEGFLYSNIGSISWSLHRELETIKSLPSLIYDVLLQNDKILILKSSISAFPKKRLYLIFMIGEGDLPPQIESKVGEYRKLVGRVRVDYARFLHSTIPDQTIELKHTVGTPHAFFSNELKGGGIAQIIYRDILSEYPIVTPMHTHDAGKLWDRLGKVEYFKIGKRLTATDKDNKSTVFKVLFGGPVKKLSDL